MKEEDDERTFTVRRFKPGNFAIYPLAPPLRPHQGGKFPLAPPPPPTHTLNFLHAAVGLAPE